MPPPPTRCGLFLAIALAPWLLLFPADAAVQTKEVWFAPSPANGSGSSSGSPRQFDWNYLKTTEIAQLKAFPVSDDKILILHFSAGTHLNVTMSDDFLATSSPTGLTSWTWIIQGDGARPEETVLKLPDAVSVPSANQDDTGYAQAGMLSFAQNSLGRFQEMKRLVLQNLTLDCNWDGQKPEYTGPQYPRSFKTFAAHLSARTGKVSKVIVRNYGSHGLVPQSVYDNSAGVETFPLTIETTDVGQVPEPGDPRPWVVEDCEIVGFRGVYAGYNTAILAQVRGNIAGAPLQYVTPDVFNDNAARRVVMVRRCQVRGPAGGSGMIGLGSAGVDDSFWSRHITFNDNILLNIGAGFNTDTGQMKWLDFQNTLFWDVSAVGYLGAINANSTFESDYNISGNSVRFYGRIAEPVYRDFNAVGQYQNLTAIPARVLGAPLVNYASGVTIVGAAQYLTITDNWFTTRPLSGFYTPDPTATGLATFRPVWKVSSLEPYGFDPLNSYFPARNPAVQVTLNNNKLSGVSFDIGSAAVLAESGTFSSFTDTTSPGHATLRPALSALLNSNFNPTGKVERLVFRTANESVSYSWLKSTASNPPLPSDTITQSFTEAVSKGADEVVLGVPSVSGNTLTVPVRLAYQPTPGSGITATAPQGGMTVWLRTTIGGAAPTAQSALTATGSGVATFSIPLTIGANSLVQFLAWKDAGSTGANNAFDEYQDAWATAQWAQNTAVWVKASPDVANDQTLARAKFHFYRTGNTTSPPVTVAFSLPVTGLKPATYGSSGTGDYTLVANAITAKAPSAWAMSGTTGGTLTFGTGQTEAVLDVVPRSDAKLENNVVYLTVDQGTGYAVPQPGNTVTPRSATVLIYDGPEFVLFQLDDYTPILAGYPTNTSAYRFANATAAYALDNNATPKIAGGATYLADAYGPKQNFGGWWTTVTPFPLTDFQNDRVGYWQGFGAPPLGVSDDGTFVGQLGNYAFRRTTIGTTFNLAHLSTLNVSAAVGINRGLQTGDATSRYIVGKSRNVTGVDRPTVWWGGSAYTPVDLGSGSPSILAIDSAGLATAANDYGVIVGWAEQTAVSPKVQRAFRSKEATFANALPLTLGDELPLPEGTANTVNNLSTAWAVNSAASIAVGSAINKPPGTYEPTAVFWPNRSTGSGPNPKALVLKEINGATDTSDATAINDIGFIGGWSKVGTTSKATLWRGASVYVLAEDLNDPHIVKLGTGWSLEAVTAINTNRVIVGNGKLNGKTRGFVMVPMPVGN